MAYKKQKPCSTPTTKESCPKITDEMIRERAYYIWEKKGRPQGQDMAIWLQAEKELRVKMR